MNAHRPPPALLLTLLVAYPTLAQQPQRVPGGELRIVGQSAELVGVCPLKHTDVTADIAGYVARVTVKQTFHNPTDRKIEAVYVFPLPAGSAVDDMVMTVGDRRIVGQIKPREEAREVYETAKAAGHVASLLDQERPNIFSQSVANIEPGVVVVIEISYVETLKYADGVFEWSFPMTVEPRYVPGAGGTAPAPMTTGQPTPEVPDANKITPPVTPKGTRAGHDISVTIHLEAGMPLFDLKSELHEIDAQVLDANRATVTLKNQAEIPNKDFILRYRLAADTIGDAFLAHSDARGTFFTLVLQPPQRTVPARLMPRELIFVLDTSGSMQGFPIEKAKEVMAKAIDQLRPGDTFNLITFSGDTHILWDAPRPATKANLDEAQKFLAERSGSGGTEMMKAIDAALNQTGQPAWSAGTAKPIRVVCFMTDGCVGNDMAIIDAVKKNAGTTRVFSFGIGNSVNRFLLDGIAAAGRGEVEYVTLAGQADAAAERFHERILAPVLTDIQIDWGDLPVSDVVPKLTPDLFSVKPIMVHGRLTGEPKGTITLRGNTGAGPFEDRIEVSTPEVPAAHLALASLWARAKIEDLMMQDYAAAQAGQFPDELKQQVTALGIEFRVMTQFTSFVAVEEMTVTVAGEPVKVNVPIEMPEGVSYEGIFGEGNGDGSVGLWFSASLAAPRVSGAPGRARNKEAAKPTTPPAAERTAGPPMGGGLIGGGAIGGGPIGVRTQEENVQAMPTQPAVTPDQAARAKLTEALRDLAAKIDKEGKDGTLAIGKLRITSWRVDVMVYLSDESAETLAALKKLGFEQTGESKAVQLLIGSIDARKLEELAKIAAVMRVRPVVEP